MNLLLRKWNNLQIYSIFISQDKQYSMNVKSYLIWSAVFHLWDLHIISLLPPFPLLFLPSISFHNILCFSSPVVTDVCRPRRFPPWCGRAALWGSWAGIALASSVSIWAGHGFSQNVAMMWLISCFASFLCSCLLLEPIKVDRDAGLPHTYSTKFTSCRIIFFLFKALISYSFYIYTDQA